MANIEKQQKQPMEQIIDAGSSADPTCRRTSHLIGGDMTNQQSDGRVHLSGEMIAGQPIILRLEGPPGYASQFGANPRTRSDVESAASGFRYTAAVARGLRRSTRMPTIALNSHETSVGWTRGRPSRV